MKYAPRKVYIKESGRYAELSYEDFCRLRETDRAYKDKLLIPVQGCLIETEQTHYIEFYRDKERWRYLQKLDKDNNLLSLEAVVTDDDSGNGFDFIADETANVEEAVVHLTGTECSDNFASWKWQYVRNMFDIIVVDN